MRTLYFGILAIILTACGGGIGGSSNTSPPPPPIPTGSVSGITFDGLIKNGDVTIYDFTTGAKGAVLGTAKSDNAGIYKIGLQIESRPLLIEATKGTYTEESSNKTVVLGATQKLTALVNYTTGTPLQVAVTSFTHVAAALAQFKINKKIDVVTAINDANKTITDIVTFDIVATLPKEISNISNASVALSPELKYGFLAGAISQWTMTNAPSVETQHLSPFASIDFAQLMFDDVFADGLLDGKGLDSAQKPLQLGFGKVPLNPDVYRFGLGTNMIDIAGGSINKTALTSANILAFAQTFGSSTDSIFAGVPTKLVTLPVPPVVVAKGVVSGKAFDGLIIGGKVRVYDFTTGTKAALLAEAVTDNNGLYSISLQLTSRPVMVEITDGYYIEEATGLQSKLNIDTNKGPIDRLTALVNYTEGSALQVSATTFSHIAAGLAQYQIGKGIAVAAAIDDANKQLSTFVGVDILSTTPLQITDIANLSVAFTPELKYGFMAGGISMWVKNNAPNYTSIKFAQLAYNDISADGFLDGMGLASNKSAIQLSLGTKTVKTNDYRYGIASNMVTMSHDINNKTGINAGAVYDYAKNIATNVAPMFNKVVPQQFQLPNITNLSISMGVWYKKNVNVTATNVGSIGMSSSEWFMDKKSIGSVSLDTTLPNASGGYPISFSLATNLYPDGKHTVDIRTTDWAGFVSTSSTDIYIDNTAPTTSINVGNPNAPIGLAGYVYGYATDTNGIGAKQLVFIDIGVTAAIDQATGYWRIDYTTFTGGTFRVEDGMGNCNSYNIYGSIVSANSCP